MWKRNPYIRLMILLRKKTNPKTNINIWTKYKINQKNKGIAFFDSLLYTLLC